MTIEDKKKSTSRRKKIEVRVDKGIANIVPEFLEHRRQDCKDMLDGLKAKNYEAVCLLGHNMRGSGGSYGFKRISELGEEIESLVIDIQKQSEQIEEAIDELSDYLEEINVVYE